jgi:hypothetical protein
VTNKAVLSRYRSGRRVVCPRCNLRGEFQKYTDGSAAILHDWQAKTIVNKSFRVVTEVCTFAVWPPPQEVSV